MLSTEGGPRRPRLLSFAGAIAIGVGVVVAAGVSLWATGLLSGFRSVEELQADLDGLHRHALEAAKAQPAVGADVSGLDAFLETARAGRADQSAELEKLNEACTAALNGTSHLSEKNTFRGFPSQIIDADPYTSAELAAVIQATDALAPHLASALSVRWSPSASLDDDAQALLLARAEALAHTGSLDEACALFALLLKDRDEESSASLVFPATQMAERRSLVLAELARLATYPAARSSVQRLLESCPDPQHRLSHILTCELLGFADHFKGIHDALGQDPIDDLFKEAEKLSGSKPTIDALAALIARALAENWTSDRPEHLESVSLALPSTEAAFAGIWTLLALRAAEAHAFRRMAQEVSKLPGDADRATIRATLKAAAERDGGCDAVWTTPDPDRVQLISGIEASALSPDTLAITWRKIGRRQSAGGPPLPPTLFHSLPTRIAESKLR